MCISYKSKNIGIFIYGSRRVLYTELDSQLQGVKLYHFVRKEFNIPLNLGILIHRGKVVNPVSTLAHQGLFNGSNVIFVTRGRGGGKNNGHEVCCKGD